MKDFKFYSHKILFILRVNRKYFLKLFFYAFLFFLISWNFLGFDALYYKRHYGKPTKQVLTVWEKEQISDYDGPLEEDNFNGYPVLRAFKKKYAVSGTLVYHDDNTSFWNKHFWNMAGENGDAYNHIASHDLTIFWGKSGLPENAKNWKVTHGLNFVDEYKCRKNCYLANDENNNFHIIPANKNLDKALFILPRSKKVPIYVEGYLTYWYGTGDYKDLKFESALDANTSSEQKIGGGSSTLCYQLYLTRFIYDGYVFE